MHQKVLLWSKGLSSISFLKTVNPQCFDPLCAGNPYMGTLANSEDPNEMLRNTTFHQALHFLLRSKRSSGTEIHHIL